MSMGTGTQHGFSDSGCGRTELGDQPGQLVCPLPTPPPQKIRHTTHKAGNAIEQCGHRGIFLFILSEVSLEV